VSDLSPFPNNLEEIAEWISSTDKISHPLALQRANDAFIDTIACILAAANEPVTNNVFEGFRGSSGGVCSVAGRMDTFSSENAAMVNGSAAHALDFDDNFIPAVTHASAVMVPALLALGEEIGATGDQLLDAYIIGLEIQAWLGHQMIPAHYEQGWHATSTIGAIGSAAACVRLMSLDENTISSAISLATSMACGSKIQFGTMSKPLHAGLASRAGITATKLAVAGVEASPNPFDGPWGFISLYKGASESNGPRIAALSILEDGLAQKRWPCCASAHRTLDSVYQLIHEHKISPNDIESIETIIPDSNCKNLRFNNPKTVNESRFSMTYTVAALVLSGSLTLDDFNETALGRTAVQDFMPKVWMKSAKAGSGDHKSIWDLPAITTITCHDGTRYCDKKLQPVGTIHAPFSEAELDAKFLACACRLFDQDLSVQFLEILRDFQSRNVRQIASLMRCTEIKLDRSIHQAVED